MSHERIAIIVKSQTDYELVSESEKETLSYSQVSETHFWSLLHFGLPILSTGKLEVVTLS